jgi:HK97 family phage major capsid protein
MGMAEKLREEATAKLVEAKAIQARDNFSAEDETQALALVAEAQALMERSQKAAGNDQTVRQMLESVTAAAGSPVTFRPVRMDRAKSPGAAFVESDEFKALRDSGVLNSDGASFRSQRFVAAAGDVISTASGAPAHDLIVPDYRPGVVPLNQRALKIRDLFPGDTTTKDSISYAQQTGFTNNAKMVAQATTLSNGAKEQSDISWTRVSAAVETMGHWMAVTRQTLSDDGQVRSLVDNQGRLMVDLAIEEQLLSGDGTSPNISGIFDQVIQTLDLSAATVDHPNLAGLRVANRMVATGPLKAPATFHVMHPNDSCEYDLIVDDNKNYMAGNPFSGQAGDGAAPIWRKARIESEAMTEGHVLVGAGVAATVLEREPLTIWVAEQHADFAIRGLVAIIFETRIGMPVYFPGGFVDVTLKAWS